MKAKKIFKGMTAAAIAAVLTASMVPMTAFALDEDGKCSVSVGTNTNSVTGSYSIYKVGTVTEVGNNAYDYAWVDGYGADLDINNITDVQDASYQLAKEAASQTATATGDIGNAVDLEPGYYLVVVTTTDAGIIASPSLFVVTKESSKTFDVKTSKITFTKKINSISEGGSVSTSKDSGVVEKGATVTYDLTAQVPSYADDVTSLETPFSITDTPSEKLTPVDEDTDGEVDVTFAVSDSGTITEDDYTITNEGTNGFKITFENAWVLANGGKTVTATFGAKVADDVVIEGTGNPNNAQLDYSNQYATGAGAANIPDEVTVYSTKITVNKTFSNNPEAGSYPEATFQLHKDTAEGAVIASGTTSTQDGSLVLNGLDAGTYVLVESGTPNGYKTADPVTIVITATPDGTSQEYTATSFSYTKDGIDSNGTIDVLNTQGQELPGTGGMGTTIFTIAGVGVVLVAGAMLVVYMRKRRTEDEE